MIYYITRDEEPIYHTLSGHFTGWQQFTFGTDSEQRTEGYLLVIENTTFDGEYFTIQTEHWFYHIGTYYLYQLDNYIGENITIHYHALNNKAYIDGIETMHS